MKARANLRRVGIVDNQIQLAACAKWNNLTGAVGGIKDQVHVSDQTGGVNGAIAMQVVQRDAIERLGIDRAAVGHSQRADAIVPHG